MQTITARNVHQALPEVMHMMKTMGHEFPSRNGPVLKVLGPVSICYQHPMERVMFWPERDANPFFHILEALWMLAGRDDVKFLADIVPRMASFSDDGVSLNAAYGYRWRHHFGFDQLPPIAEALKKDRYDRRQVLSMWDAGHDLQRNTKDLPCNTQVFFSRTDTGALDMTVTNRSNDAVWGALGANAVHFSMLQEYLAVMIGCSVGKYWQVTNNLHLYLDHHRALMDKMAAQAYPSQQFRRTCPYENGVVEVTNLIPSGDVATFDRDVEMVLNDDVPLGIRDWFCRKAAIPMMLAIQTYKGTEMNQAQRVLAAQRILGDNMNLRSDWRLAACNWLEKRNG
ncbi:hypothetical protein LCGC14_0599580 [marine sediment metagenome]|uniref:Thymidylate synthase/dCMP hydroxymethylase domain-containing protein n=1 Tax=marine sediment metagenome TaxID=412755 RepID=A0A0F9UJB2_9ZZZZ